MKYISFDSESKVCDWIDNNPSIKIIAITQDRTWYTIFYKDE